MSVREISARELAEWLADANRVQPLLVDVREAWELERVAIAGVTHIPMNQIPLRMSELPDGQPIITVCHHGVRSFQVGLYLANAGFEDVISLKGGVEAWACDVDPAIGHY